MDTFNWDDFVWALLFGNHAETEGFSKNGHLLGGRSKKSNINGNLTLKLYIERELYVKVSGKTDNFMRELKTLYPNFENVLSEFISVLNVMYVLKVEQKEQNW